MKQKNIQRPEIQREVFEGSEIKEFRAKKTVAAFGTTGHITLPKYLIGKRVLIILEENGSAEN